MKVKELRKSLMKKPGFYSISINGVEYGSLPQVIQYLNTLNRDKELRVRISENQGA